MEEEKDEKWNEEKQRADQAEANLRKAKSALDESTGKISVYETRISELEKQIEKVREIPKDELDPMRSDIPDLVKVLQETQKDLNDLRGSHQQLEKLAEQYRQAEEVREKERTRQNTIDKVCKPLDEKYGAKHRNQAIELYNKAVEDGSEKKPEDTLDAHYGLEKYYKMLAEKKEKKEKTPSDNGTGSFLFKEDIGEGPLDQVIAKMRAVGFKT